MAYGGWLLCRSAHGVADLRVDNFECHTEGGDWGAALAPLRARIHGFVPRAPPPGRLGVLDNELRNRV